MTAVTVEKITEHEDGSMTIELEMGEDMLVFLAKLGMLELIRKAAEREIDGYSNPEGSGDGYARGSRDQDLFGEIPGL